jgi:hypothetical protein
MIQVMDSFEKLAGVVNLSIYKTCQRKKDSNKKNDDQI